MRVVSMCALVLLLSGCASDAPATEAPWTADLVFERRTDHGDFGQRLRVTDQACDAFPRGCAGRGDAWNPTGNATTSIERAGAWTFSSTIRGCDRHSFVSRVQPATVRVVVRWVFTFAWPDPDAPPREALTVTAEGGTVLHGPESRTPVACTGSAVT